MNTEVSRRAFLRKTGEAALIVGACAGRIMELEGAREAGKPTVELVKEKVTGIPQGVSKQELFAARETQRLAEEDSHLAQTREALKTEQLLQGINKHKSDNIDSLKKGGALVVTGGLSHPKNMRIIRNMFSSRTPDDVIRNLIQSDDSARISKIEQTKIGVKMVIQDVKDFVKMK